MRIRHLVLGLVLGVTGCDQTKKVEAFADKACACKDKACSKAVLDEFVTWAEKNKDARGDEKKAEQAATRMFECIQKSGLEPDQLMPALERLQKLQ